ncbi:MAG: hypothetical protein HUU35_16635, partial [Armatimonadetes bacterium]|nr:hypothetical protein [Armatimonadota bacterium]
MSRFAWLGLCLLVLPLAGQEVNHALAAQGGILSAHSAQTGLQFAAGKAADDNPATGWLSGPERPAGWLRVEWRYAVEIRSVGLRPWAESPVAAGALGRVSIEVPEGEQWREVAGFEAAV